MRRLSSFTKKTVTSHDGLSLYYEVAGTGKDMLFFLHGMGGDVAAWDEIRIFFHQLGYSTIALDLRGHGYSGHPKQREGYHLKHFAQDVDTVLREEQVKRFVLIGHCFGGMVAYHYEIYFPGNSEKLILISTSYRAPYLSQQAPLKKALHAIIRFAAPRSSRRYVPRHANYAEGKFEHDFEPFGLFQVIKHNSLQAYLSLTDEVFSLDILENIREITTPTLLLVGSNDSIYPPRMSKDLHHRIKNSQLAYIEQGNHPVVLNNPMEVSVAAAKFLQKNPV